MPAERRDAPDAAHDAAHDVLAAEEFGVPAPDPALHHEPARDVLAAEEFGVPAPDPRLHPGPVSLPDDPSGIAEPHDVLAAEEFAVPAGRTPSELSWGDTERWGAGGSRLPLAGAGVGALAVVALLLRFRRR